MPRATSLDVYDQDGARVMRARFPLPVEGERRRREQSVPDILHIERRRNVLNTYVSRAALSHIVASRSLSSGSAAL